MDLMLKEYTNIPEDVIKYIITPYLDCCECKRPNKCMKMNRKLWCKDNGCGKQPKIGKNKRLYYSKCMCVMIQQNIDGLNNSGVRKWRYINKLL